MIHTVRWCTISLSRTPYNLRRSPHACASPHLRTHIVYEQTQPAPLSLLLATTPEQTVPAEFICCLVIGFGRLIDLVCGDEIMLLLLFSDHLSIQTISTRALKVSCHDILLRRVVQTLKQINQINALPGTWHILYLVRCVLVIYSIIVDMVAVKYIISGMCGSLLLLSEPAQQSGKEKYLKVSA